MNNNDLSGRRWLLSGTYLGMIVMLLACSFLTGVQQNEDGTMQMNNGVIQVKNENGDWVPVAGEATFEMIGILESTDPWTVAGRTFETNDSSQIDENLQVGDLVSVQGAVLDDNTWVAYSIKLAEEKANPTLVLIGVVTSVDPWVVNGVKLNVTANTDIQGDITIGMIVRVEIALLEDGTWEVLSISSLGASTETSGCSTVIATVVSVDGDQVQFLGWPITLTLGQVTSTETLMPGNTNDDEGENDETDDSTPVEMNNVSAGQIVMAVICASDDGTFVIVQITVLNMEENGDNGGTSTDGGEKVLVCHKPNNKKGGHTLSIPQSAVPAHLGHGDTLGPCP